MLFPVWIYKYPCQFKFEDKGDGTELCLTIGIQSELLKNKYQVGVDPKHAKVNTILYDYQVMYKSIK